MQQGKLIKRWALGLLGGAVLALLAALAAQNSAGSEGGAAKPAAAALEFTGAELVRPQRLALPGQINFSGPLVAPSTAVVRAKSAGTLVGLSVEEGSRVRAGQRLGEIDLSELNARLHEREAQALAARAQMAQAERTWLSNQRLAEQQFISANALDAARAALDTAQAQYQAAQAQVDTVRISLREAALVAPIAGIVAKRQVVPGEKVAAEQALLSIVDLRQLEMAGSVGTHEVSQLQIGMPVALEVEGWPEPLSGQLQRIAPAAEAGTRAITVTVALANPQERLRAGQYAKARVSLPAGGPRLTVPLTALSASSGQEYVWTLEQGKLMRRVVVTGRRDPLRGLVEVTEGLPEGAPVLATRFENLREGAPARWREAAPREASPSAS